MARALRTRRAERWNAWLSTFLLLAVAVQANRLASDRLRVRHDFSEDQLFAISDVTRGVLGRLEDHLQVRAYFTEDVESGQMALLKARVEAQLDELAALGGLRVELDLQDPTVYSAVREEARGYGISPIPTAVGRGVQEVWLGAVLRYRGRTEVLPRLDPWTLESKFVQGVHRLITDRRPKLGWTGVPLEGTEGLRDFGTFQAAAARFGVRYELVEVPVADLESGAPVPQGLEALVVVRPEYWHARAAFALDQYIQRGGRALVFIDRVWHDAGNGSYAARLGRAPAVTGLEALLASYGAPVLPAHVWDPASAGRRVRFVGVSAGPDGGRQAQRLLVDDPACPTLTGTGLSGTFPPTAQLTAIDLYWAQPIQDAQPPNGVVREDFLTSSDTAYVTDRLLEAAAVRQDEVDGMTTSLMFARGTRDTGHRVALGTVLSGRFPSPFAKAGAPEPFDVSTMQRGERVGTTDEPILSAAGEARVIVIGDADWMRDPRRDAYGPVLPGLTETHAILLENLVDWLVQDDELIGVRSKEPRERPLVDLYAEELAAAGVVEGDDLMQTEELQRRRREQRELARARAEARRWRAMLLPLSASIALVLGAGLVWNVRQRRTA